MKFVCYPELVFLRNVLYLLAITVSAITVEVTFSLLVFEIWYPIKGIFSLKVTLHSSFDKQIDLNNFWICFQRVIYKKHLKKAQLCQFNTVPKIPHLQTLVQDITHGVECWRSIKSTTLNWWQFLPLQRIFLSDKSELQSSLRSNTTNNNAGLQPVGQRI